jgi:hypothetical protein
MKSIFILSSLVSICFFGEVTDNEHRMNSLEYKEQTSFRLQIPSDEKKTSTEFSKSEELLIAKADTTRGDYFFISGGYLK